MQATLRRAFRLLIVGSLMATITSSLVVYPHSLAYFNEITGGPNNGHKHLLGSNLDWGQDLLFLREWLAEHPTASPFYLAYSGFFDPTTLGIGNVLPLPTSSPSATIASDDQQSAGIRLKKGWYGLSENLVWGTQWDVWTGGKTIQPLLGQTLVPFRTRSPIAKCGYSIWIYEVPDVSDDAAQVQH
jgi:hypothetical protein